MKTLPAESPRFPGIGQSAQGESAPKARLKSVVDGKQVNIPAPVAWSEAGAERGSQAGYWIPVQARRRIVSLSTDGR